jgi:ferredoxin-NADP reductase
MVQPVLEWQAGTITAIRPETQQTKSFTLALPKWMAHRPGQHYDVRLTAPDGYQTQRSYSIASPPERVGELELTVERIADGEVSPYLHDVLTVGDQLEVRGPIGGYFVWDVGVGGPLLLVAGGSGVVPLMAMLRHRRLSAPELPMRLLYSARTAEEVIYADELGDDAIVTLTRSAAPDWTGHTGRIDADLVASAAFDSGPAFVCGSNAFVEAAVTLLLGAGYEPDRVRTERFGPTG